MLKDNLAGGHQGFREQEVSVSEAHLIMKSFMLGTWAKWKKTLFSLVLLPYYWHHPVTSQKCESDSSFLRALSFTSRVTQSWCHQVREGEDRDQKETIFTEFMVCLWPGFSFCRIGQTGALVKGVLWFVHFQRLWQDEYFIKQSTSPRPHLTSYFLAMASSWEWKLIWKVILTLPKKNCY